MADKQSADQEPSIEEILDSIRQIISDDDDSAPEPAAAPPPAKPEPTPPPAPKEDIVELVDRFEEEPEPAPPPPPRPQPPAPKPQPVIDPIEVEMRDLAAQLDEEPSVESILSQRSQNAAFEAFSELAERAAVERGGTVTIEDIVREEIKPMLREWIDRHLPKMLERLLQKELERISRRAQDE